MTFNSSTPYSKSPEHHFLDLRTIVKLIIQKKNIVILMSILFFVVAMLIVSLRPTYYQSKILLKIQNTELSALSNNTNKLDSPNFINLQEPVSVQIALLESDFILKSVIDALKLDIILIPHNKFFIKNTNELVINSLNVDSKWLNKKLELVIVNNKSYQLYSSGHTLLLEGKTGQTITDQYHTLAINIETIHALPGSHFTLIKSPDYPIINQIKSHFNVSYLNKPGDNNNDSVAILQLSLTGKNPQSILDMLNKMAFIIQDKNVTSKYRQADKVLSFLEQELPILQRSLQTAEQKLNEYRAANGRINVELQTDYLLNHLSNLDKQLENIRIRKTNLLQQYTLYHPAIISLNDEVHELEKQRQALLIQLKKLPASNQEDVNLMRDVKIKNDLYIQLLNQIHQLQVDKAGIVSDIQILSPAAPPEYVPHISKALVALISLLTGLFFSASCVLFWGILSGKIFAIRMEGPMLGI
jgi:tyrosine-protein kinase Etk/Wzc